ncbi:MAG: hypothetical protein M1834_006051 [Cirrosporium novae-zelandiae]|nr:MAG: hypothetical protein M1834_006051 [Cirrosporium novae-zelandiae]
MAVLGRDIYHTDDGHPTDNKGAAFLSSAHTDLENNPVTTSTSAEATSSETNASATTSTGLAAASTASSTTSDASTSTFFPPGRNPFGVPGFAISSTGSNGAQSTASSASLNSASVSNNGSGLSLTTTIVIAILVPVVVIASILGALCCLRRRRQRRTAQIAAASSSPSDGQMRDVHATTEFLPVYTPRQPTTTNPFADSVNPSSMPIQEPDVIPRRTATMHSGYYTGIDTSALGSISPPPGIHLADPDCEDDPPPPYAPKRSGSRATNATATGSRNVEATGLMSEGTGLHSITQNEDPIGEFRTAGVRSPFEDPANVVDDDSISFISGDDSRPTRNRDADEISFVSALEEGSGNPRRSDAFSGRTNSGVPV